MATRKKVGIGIIGTGMIANYAHMPGYSKLERECSIVAAADINPEALGKAAEKFNIPKTYSNYKDLLKDPDVEAVSICVPNYFHMEPTIAALKAGKHVICEKPLSRNGDESRKMVKAAADSGKILQVALQYRFSGYSQYLKRFIDAGKLGNVYYARAQALRRRGIPGWGVFYDKEKQGGGPLVDIGVHILDLTLFLMGYPKPVSASGRAFQKFGKRSDVIGLMGQWNYKDFTVEDFAVGHIRFNNGAVVVLESSFCANIKNDIMVSEIMGERAGIRVNTLDEPHVEIYGEEDGALFDMMPAFLPKHSPYDVEIATFVDSIRHGKKSVVPGEQGLILNGIFDALYKSSESGKEEPVNLKV